MTNNQHSFYKTRNFTYNIYSKLTQNVTIYDRKVGNHITGSLWNVSKRTLDYYWTQNFNEYGTSLQNPFNENVGKSIPFCEYLRNSIKSCISNEFYGLIRVESFEENENWDICTSTPPTTVLNCLRYTPHKMENSDITAEFLIYQILSAIEELHNYNISHLGLTLDNLYIDENYLLKLSLPNLNTLSERIKYSMENNPQEELLKNESQCLDSIVWKWISGEISNLDYLLYLNKLAGRTESDPNNHCMIPWVTDFRVPFEGLRDLKLSKFRINKGDDHLNKIFQDQLEEFEHFENDNPLDDGCNKSIGPIIDISSKGVFNSKSKLSKGKLFSQEYYNQFFDYQPSYPHHVSDILSELSYYAYMARITPIDILRKSYRSFYNPQEFRWNMTKMYDWTPDECIPQFFTDPSVFRSVHNDMPDIELPAWCKTPDEFVNYHRLILESPEVSSELHHWIDLVFGYKLIGEEAIKAKNVHRQFADRSNKITNNGLTVLFRSPHPKRLCSSQNLRKYFSSKRPNLIVNENTINQQNENSFSLPADYDPTELLDYYKEYSLFIQDSCNQEAVELKPVNKICKSLFDIAFEEDIISACCLIVEIFNFAKLRADYLFSSTNLKVRVESCHLLLSEDPSRIPLKFRVSVEKVINSYRENSGRIPDIFELKNSDKWLLFNKSTIKLFDLIKDITFSKIYPTNAINYFFSCQTENIKFDMQTLNILTPHLVHLLQPNSDVLFEKTLDVLVSVTHQFGLISGKPYFIKNILPHIINLYPKVRNEVKSLHALLYQRTFLNILLIRIGLIEFLSNITELLVQMLIIGQNTFGSMKEPLNSPEIEMKIPIDTNSTNDTDSSSIWYIQNGGNNNAPRSRLSQMSINSDSEYNKPDLTGVNQDSDSISQCSFETEEPRIPSPKHSNTFIPINQPNVLDNLPLSDIDNTEDICTPPKTKNGSLTQLLSPFRKSSTKKQRRSHSKSSKIKMRQNLSQDCSKMSLANLSCSSLIWLSDLIGPIQSCSKILCELLAQFLLCYKNFQFDELSLDMSDDSKMSFVTGTYDSYVKADLETTVIFDCLREFISLYGLAVVDHQFRHFLDTLLDKSKFFTDDFGADTETNLLCSLSLLRFLGMVIPDDYLESFLTEKILDDYLPLIIKCVGNMAHPFPSGVRARKVLFHKTIDLIYLLSSRLKYDQVQLSMCNVFKLLFGLFNKTFKCNENGEVRRRSVSIDVFTPKTEKTEYYINFVSDENDFTIQSNEKMCSTPEIEISLITQRQSAFEEMKSITTTELAYVLYVTFAKLLGQNRLNSLLCNHAVIQALVFKYENDSNKTDLYCLTDKIKQQKLEDALQYYTTSVMAYKKRHLSCSWNQYWVHELGFCDSEPFDIKQMCLGKFEGHNNAVKGFDVLNCENGFLSYGKDKFVKLFSCGDIEYSNVSNEVVSRFNYSHLKPVTSALFIDQMRLAVSLDGLVHLWDPFVGKRIHDSSLGVTTPNWSMVCCLPPTHYQIAVANIDGRIQIVDLRSGTSTYSYNLNINHTSSHLYGDFATSMGVPGGFIKEISGTPCGNQLVIGNSEGFLSIIDLRMSKLLQTLRPHQNEITQIKFLKNWCVTSSSEPMGKLHLFSLSNFAKNQVVYGSDLGPIYSIMMLRNQILVGASQNRFGLFTGVNQYKSLNRLSSVLYKGTATTASLLLHNKLLLLGNDFGNISLWY